ncbi:MAG: alpha/beta fold hydrolase, partial [Promethearchaeota archaeon]
LLIYGSRDRDVLEVSDYMNRMLPNSTLELIEGIGHGLLIEAPEIVNNLMWNFLKEHLTSSI